MLEQWLIDHNAFHVWTVKPSGSAQTPTIQAWRLGNGIVLVMLYPHRSDGTRGGWGLATEPNTHHIGATFADAEQRTGAKHTANVQGTTKP